MPRLSLNIPTESQLRVIQKIVHFLGREKVDRYMEHRGFKYDTLSRGRRSASYVIVGSMLWYSNVANHAPDPGVLLMARRAGKDRP